MVTNVLNAVRTIVANDAAVQALCDWRVFGVSLPDSVDMPSAVVVITRSGGTSDLSMWIARSRIDVRCYGRDDIESNLVWREVHRVLKDITYVRSNDCLLYSVRTESGPMDTLEPNVEWPMTLCVYNVMANELAFEVA